MGSNPKPNEDIPVLEIRCAVSHTNRDVIHSKTLVPGRTDQLHTQGWMRSIFKKKGELFSSIPLNFLGQA